MSQSDLYSGEAGTARQGFRKITNAGGSKSGEKYWCIDPQGNEVTITATSENGDDLSSDTISQPIYGRFTDVTITTADVTIFAYIFT